MNLRRHLIPGIVLAAILLAAVAVASQLERPRESSAPPAGETVATTTAPAGSAEETPAPTRLVREEGAEVPTALKTASVPEGTAALLVEGTRYALTAPAGATLKDALDRLMTESGFTYEYRNYSGLGAFVTKVNGRASTGELVWILYVNEAKSSTGISSTRIHSGDTFEWKLEQSY